MAELEANLDNLMQSDANIIILPETGELVGVLNDYVMFAADSMSNQKLEFDVVGFDSIEDEIQALKDDEIDLIFHFTQNPYVAEQNGFALSSTVLSLNMAAVTAQNYFNEISGMFILRRGSCERYRISGMHWNLKFQVSVKF